MPLSKLHSLSLERKKVNVLVAQSCPTLCDLVDYSPPGSSVHGILQARILDWVAILFSRAFSQPRDRTQVHCTEGRFFTIWDCSLILKYASGCYCLMIDTRESTYYQFIWSESFAKFGETPTGDQNQTDGKVNVKLSLTGDKPSKLWKTMSPFEGACQGVQP